MTGLSYLMIVATHLVAASTAHAIATHLQTLTFVCADGRRFAVTREKRAASVVFENKTFSLARRPSGIGVRYANSRAALIIDGEMAAFVTDTVTDLQRCRVRH